MKRALWINLALLALVVAAGFGVFFAPTENAPPRYPLSSLKADMIDTITVEARERDPVRLQRREGAWFLAAPFEARADPLRVDGLLGVLAAQSDKRFPATEPARFGLDAPRAQLTLGTQVFRFGASHPLNHQIYVETGGVVYLISPIYFVDVARLPEDYAARTLLGEAEQPVGFAAGKVRLTRAEGRWVVEPGQTELTQDAANALADDWRQLQAAAVTRTAGTPLATLTVKLANGRTLPFEVLRREPEWAIRRVDEGLSFHFPTEQAKRLLRPLALAP